MTAPDIAVDPAALDEAARTYRREAMAAQDDLGKLWAAAPLPADAFGHLPQSPELASTYVRFDEQVRADLQAFAQSLASCADSLGVCAAGYSGTDAVLAANLLQSARILR